ADAFHFQNDIKGAKLVIFKNLGHNSIDEDANATAAAVAAFLKPIPPVPRRCRKRRRPIRRLLPCCRRGLGTDQERRHLGEGLVGAVRILSDRALIVLQGCWSECTADLQPHLLRRKRGSIRHAGSMAVSVGPLSSSAGKCGKNAPVPRTGTRAEKLIPVALWVSGPPAS
ncbi:MAG TPA: hypothetical protein VK776_15830, partial [Bryobacteraceae bacterium]|nr:hypothetical protein [Bryobacteraceae bacterium]